MITTEVVNYVIQIAKLANKKIKINAYPAIKIHFYKI